MSYIKDSPSSSGPDFTGLVVIIIIAIIIVVIVALIIKRRKPKNQQAVYAYQSTQKFCTACGTPNPKDVQYCGKCGKKFLE